VGGGERFEWEQMGNAADAHARRTDGNRGEDGKCGRLQLRKGIGVQNHACVGKTSFFSQSWQRLERRSFQIRREYFIGPIDLSRKSVA